jgi:hypothetical protein
MPAAEILIRVHSRWDDWRTADVRLEDLQDVQWLQPAGAPHEIMHGYISCSNVRNGNIPHDCARRSAPHRLVVCILKRHTSPLVYATLVRQADQRRPLQSDLRTATPVRVAVR